MTDNLYEPKQDVRGEPDPNSPNIPQKSDEDIATSENANAIAKYKDDSMALPSAGADIEESNEAPITDDDEADKTISFNDKPKENFPGDKQVGTDLLHSTEDAEEIISFPTDVAAENNDISPSQEQPAPATESPSPNGESQKSETIAVSDDQTRDFQLLPVTGLPDPVETKLADDAASRPLIHKTDVEPSSPPMEAVKEENTTEVIDKSAEESHEIPLDQTNKKPSGISLEELVREASESSNKKTPKPENASLTARLYGEQIRTGNLKRLTSVIRNEDGTSKLANPGAVPQWNTVDISLIGKVRRSNYRSPITSKLRDECLH